MKTKTTQALVIEWAKQDAQLFADEYPGELLDPAATDWDATCWSESRREVPVPADRQEALWPVYQRALIDEVARLAAVRS